MNPEEAKRKVPHTSQRMAPYNTKTTQIIKNESNTISYDNANIIKTPRVFTTMGENSNNTMSFSKAIQI